MGWVGVGSGSFQTCSLFFLLVVFFFRFDFCFSFACFFWFLFRLEQINPHIMTPHLFFLPFFRQKQDEFIEL